MQVDISEIAPYSTNLKGETYELANDRLTNMVLCFRNENTISGNHYHTGLVSNKNPEILYLIQGVAIFRWRFLNSPEKIKERIVKGPCKITIPILVWHQFEAKTNLIFLELNSLEDGRRDVSTVEPV